MIRSAHCARRVVIQYHGPGNLWINREPTFLNRNFSGNGLERFYIFPSSTDPKLHALVYDILPLEEGAGKRSLECVPATLPSPHPVLKQFAPRPVGADSAQIVPISLFWGYVPRIWLCVVHTTFSYGYQHRGRLTYLFVVAIYIYTLQLLPPKQLGKVV